MRIRMTVEYDGTDFAGWQRQPDRPTVQGTLERALQTVLRHPVHLAAAGRTDAGVHARGQVAAFSTTAEPDLDALERSLNALAGPAIAVSALAVVAHDFDPRREARGRVYEYRITNRRWPSPFSRRFAWHVREPLDLAAVASAAAHVVGEHDFSAFRAADCDADNPVRRVTQSELMLAAEHVVYRIAGTAFVRHMVRNLVGTLVEVGRGDRSPADFARVLAARDRTLAGPTAPALGLHLVRVDYE